MLVFDLTHEISENNIVFPGHPQPHMETVYTLEKNGYQVSYLAMMSHHGTHIDAPIHTLKGGVSLFDIPISNFCGKAVLIDIRNIINTINVGDLIPYANKIEQCRFVVFMCGHEHLWGTEQYLYNYPILSENASRWLCEFELYGIGLDTFSVDTIDSKSHIIHRIFATKGMIIIENITHLEELYNAVSPYDSFFYLTVFPLKYRISDGSPIRAVAFTNCPFEND